MTPIPASETTLSVDDGHGYKVVIASPAGTTLTASFEPLPGGVASPSGIQFPYDQLLVFSVGSLPPGTITVTITLPPSYPHVTTFYKYGPDSDPHYYPYQLAEESSNPDNGEEVITLEGLQDGGAGDDYGTPNGVIADPGLRRPPIPIRAELCCQPLRRRARPSTK